MKVLRLNRNLFFLSLICILLLGAAGLSACTGSAPTPSPTATPTPTPSPTPSPNPTPPPEEEWSADGIITVGEYHGSNTYGDFEVYWRSNDQYVYIGMKAKTNGWLSIAIQPGSKMKNADMVFCFIKDGELTIVDSFSTGDFGPHPPDIELGGTNNILESTGIEEDGFTTIEFKRLLDTGDQYDIHFSKGVNKIIWAYGSRDSLSAKHSARGYGEIVL